MDDKASGKFPEGHPFYAPGLKWRSRVGGDVPYWVPPAKDTKAGYLPKSRTLDVNASQLEIAEACRNQWRDLAGWRSGKPMPVKMTIAWLIGRYLTDETSPFHKVGADTQKSYQWECKRIRETVGERRLDPKLEGGAWLPRRTGEDFRRWHYNWGQPKPLLDEAGEEVKRAGVVVMVASTPSRATHCIAMLRTLLSYNVEIGTRGALDLRAMLSAMRFEKPGARDKAPTYEQTDAIVNKAMEMGYRSIAITTLAQYELIERRTHIIGQWNDDAWSRGWVWDGQIALGQRLEWVGVTPDWRIRYFQTKKGANLREYDLKVVQRLLGLMQDTPKEARTGAIIICESTGEPWDTRRYQAKFREIARAAGVPDDVWSMDMRSGGATEADDLEEVTDRMFDDAGGWADPAMKNRYRRQKSRNAQKVVVLRQAARDKQ
jgi:hypothetical protein